MSDRFIFIDECAHEFGKSVARIREIAEAQHGVFAKARISNRCLKSYPQFSKGPGGRWGIFESQLTAYWNSLRTKHENIVDAQQLFRAAGGRR